jgi:hypothetical protein
MQFNHEDVALAVTNPIQAISVIFYRPKMVFTALSVKENWSWIPFFLLSVVLFLPPYLYFSIVDFEWWLNAAIMPTLSDFPPSLQENALAQYSSALMQLTYGLASSLSLIWLYVIKALFFTIVTRNDDKSIQGFSDWYGATWWMAMPMLVNSLLSLILLTFQDPGAQINSTMLAPLSIAFLFSIDMSSPWFDMLSDIRLDVIWSIWLGYVCLRTWTNFSQARAFITAIFPAAFLWTILIVTAIV